MLYQREEEKKTLPVSPPTSYKVHEHSDYESRHSAPSQGIAMLGPTSDIARNEDPGLGTKRARPGCPNDLANPRTATSALGGSVCPVGEKKEGGKIQGTTKQSQGHNDFPSRQTPTIPADPSGTGDGVGESHVFSDMQFGAMPDRRSAPVFVAAVYKR